MQYTDSYEASAECLRLALGQMAQHKVAVNPLNYSIWYEYVSRRNAQLRELLDRLLREGKVPRDEEAERIFREFILDGDEARLEGVQMQLRKLLESILDSTAEMDARAARYGESLDNLAPRLCDDMSVDTIREVIGALMAGTESMRESNASMRAELEQKARTVEELRRELDSARQQALVDPLTGLCNRKGLDQAVADHLRELRSGDDGGPLCVLLLDIDHFKRVNDTFGHLFGDKVIQGVANVLRQSLKGQDTAARYGGEEFAVVLPDTGLDDALKVAEFVRQRLARSRIRRRQNNGEMSQESVTASLGVAEYRPGEPLESWLERADAALYLAKQQGRNRVVGEVRPAAG